MKLIIDASNLISGGGLSHLKELIKSSKPNNFGIDHIVVWGPTQTLEKLEEKSWLKKETHPYLNRSYLHRTLWKWFILKKSLDNKSILFIPGTGIIKSTVKVVTMCRNMLPIDKAEMNRFWPSLVWLRYKILRVLHFHAYKRSDGLIFLNQYAFEALPNKISSKVKSHKIIPHGLGWNFKKNRKKHYQLGAKINVLYVSRINLYKHQWNVAEAVLQLNYEGFNICLKLVGGMKGPGRKKLDKVINKYGPQYSNRIEMYDVVPHGKLPSLYKSSDIFVFASTCENHPNILIEAMGSGLPIACSCKSSMKSILKDGGVYFDPEDVASLKSALMKLIKEDCLRKRNGEKAFKLSSRYSWEKCANETLKYISEVYKQ